MKSWRFSGVVALMLPLLCGGTVTVEAANTHPSVPPIDVVSLIHTPEHLQVMAQEDSVARILERALDPTEARQLARKVVTAAIAESVDPVLFGALVLRESWADPNAVSWAGAVGLAQIMPKYWHNQNDACTGDLFDAETNLACGARVLRYYLDTCGSNVRCALNRYWGGYRIYTSGNSPYVSRIEKEVALL